MSFDIQETTISFDHINKELHIYTSKRSVFLAFIKRSPDYIKAEHKCGGYFLIYSGDSIRKPELVLKSEPGGLERLQEWLTPQEQARREAAAQQIQERRLQAR